MRYESVIDTSNKNNSHTLTIDLIAETAKGRSLDILDVGCSAGYLGEYLRSQGHHVTGIDITPEAVVKASGFLNEVHCLKVEDFFNLYYDRQFDIVIFGDVLEHVTNAEEVLTLTTKALKPSGKVVASIPNVGHLAVRAMLLEGRWEYSDLGLLDRDHVRFFTLPTIHQLFANTSYNVNDVRTTNLPVETVDEMCGMHLDPIFIEAARSVAANDESASVFQYVVLAEPKCQGPRVVCLLPSMDNGLFNFRAQIPLENWAKKNYGAVRFRLLGKQSADDLLWGDIFLFQRMGGAYTIHMINVLKEHGKCVVFEIDDLLTDLPDFLSHHHASPETQQSLFDAIRLADIVTTTTPRLAEKLAAINPKVMCVPNCIEIIPPTRVAHLDSVAPKATLIVASSDSVLVDCLIQPLIHIQKIYGAEIELVVVGPIADTLRAGGLVFKSIPILSYVDFCQLLQTLINPIGLIPLDSSTFSSCKSPIKFFDYSIAQIPSICSNVPPYSDYVQNATTGLLVNNDSAAWIDALETLIESVEMRCKISEAARQYVIDTHMADKAAIAWQSVIEKLDIQRVRIPGLVEASVTQFKPNINIRWIIKKLLQIQTYSKIRLIISKEGVKGLVSRIMKW
jgi:O-antigen biosynthesis protein